MYYGFFVQKNQIKDEADRHNRFYTLDFESSYEPKEFNEDILPEHEQDQDIKQAKARHNKGKYKIILLIEGLGLSEKKLEFVSKLPPGFNMGISPYTQSREELFSKLEELNLVASVNLPFKSSYYPQKFAGSLVISPQMSTTDNTKNLDFIFSKYSSQASAYYIKPDQDLSKFTAELSVLSAAVGDNGSKLFLSYPHKKQYKHLKQYFSAIEKNIYFIDKEINSVNNKLELIQELQGLANEAKANNGTAVALVEANKLTIDTIIKWQKQLPPDIELTSIRDL